MFMMCMGLMAQNTTIDGNLFVNGNIYGTIASSNVTGMASQVYLDDLIPPGFNTATNDCSSYLWQAASQSPNVILGARTYLITNQLVFTNSLNLRGAGRNLTTLLSGVTTGPFYNNYPYYIGVVNLWPNVYYLSNNILPGYTNILLSTYATNLFNTGDWIYLSDNGTPDYNTFAFTNNHPMCKREELLKIKAINYLGTTNIQLVLDQTVCRTYYATNSPFLGISTNNGGNWYGYPTGGNQKQLTVVGITFQSITNGYINNSNSFINSSPADGIYLQHAIEPTFSDVGFKDFFYASMTIHNSRRLHMDNCDIRSSYWRMPQNTGFGFDAYDTIDSHLNNFYLENIQTLSFSYSVNGVVENIMSKNTANGGVDLHQAGSYNFTFNNCTAYEMSTGMGIGATDHDSVMNNCSSYNSYNSSIYMAGYNVTVNNFTSIKDAVQCLQLRGCSNVIFNSLTIKSLQTAPNAPCSVQSVYGYLQFNNLIYQRDGGIQPNPLFKAISSGQANISFNNCYVDGGLFQDAGYSIGSISINNCISTVNKGNNTFTGTNLFHMDGIWSYQNYSIMTNASDPYIQSYGYDDRNGTSLFGVLGPGSYIYPGGYASRNVIIMPRLNPWFNNASYSVNLPHNANSFIEHGQLFKIITGAQSSTATLSINENSTNVFLFPSNSPAGKCPIGAWVELQYNTNLNSRGLNWNVFDSYQTPANQATNLPIVGNTLRYDGTNYYWAN